MNNIVIYGPGCAKCAALAEVTKLAMQELRLEAPLEKVSDARQFAAAGVLVTPALAVNGNVLVSGTVPSRGEIKKILQETMQDGSSPQEPCCCTRSPKSFNAKEVVSEPEERPCACDGGGCCGKERSGSASGWKRAVAWVVVALILLAAVKFINHWRNGGSEKGTAAIVPVKSGR